MHLDVLDNPVLSTLTGRHAHLAERRGRAVRALPEVSPFCALPGDADEQDWRDLGELVGPGGTAVLFGRPALVASGWEPEFSYDGVQLLGTRLRPRPDPDAVVLGAADVPEMIDLVTRTRPGPFGPRTIELGTYLGIRRGGALVAMAGERMSPTGWTEISAVCTDPAHRGQGLGGRLIAAVAVGIVARGEAPFLHTVASNTGAIRLYEALGFELRRHLEIAGWRAPATAPGS